MGLPSISKPLHKNIDPVNSPSMTLLLEEVPFELELIGKIGRKIQVLVFYL